MKRMLLTLFTLLTAVLLFSDLVEEPGYDHNIIGPAYTGEQVAFISDTLYVTNTGGSDEFTVIMHVDGLPDGWYGQFCQEYEGVASTCVPAETSWSFNFERNTTIAIDFTFVYSNSPEEFNFELVWTAASIEDVVMDFTFRTEDSMDSSPAEIIPGVVLEGNYPNPFNPETQIAYSLENSENVELSIYNAKGMLINKLLSGYQDSGRHIEIWDGKNSAGETVSSGVYFYRLVAGNKVFSKKMMLIK